MLTHPLPKAASSSYLDEDGLLYYADANKQFPVPIIDRDLGLRATEMGR